MSKSTAIIGADVPAAGTPPKPDLARVRRYEAAGFRAWPAASVHYDGTWVIRLTADHPAKRLNSVNPLDPNDLVDLDDRIARAARRFEAYGRTLTFRLSPLSGAVLARHFDRRGWNVFSESVVMRLPLENAPVKNAVDHIPLRDIGRFAAAAREVSGFDPELGSGLSELLARIQPNVGLFILEDGGKPVASAISVHDNDLAGFFEIATAVDERGKGHARRLVLSALKWARSRGAREAWLQVEADNEPARRLYQSLGFIEVYRYHYRQPPEN
jgi:ribosomal protein S18 acetylase RimI-like enzyme